MPIRRINTNSDLESIISGMPNGKEANYLLNNLTTTELDYLVTLSDVLGMEGKKPFIRVKYDWEYGQRPRVIEVVATVHGKIELYKRVSASNFDKHIFNLIRLRDSISKRFDIDEDLIVCTVVFVQNNYPDKIDDIISQIDNRIKYRIL